MVTRPAQTHPDQPDVGVGHHLLATGQRLLGLLVRLSGYGALSTGRLPEELVTTAWQRAFLPAAHPGTTRPLRPRLCPIGRAVLRQRLPRPAP